LNFTTNVLGFTQVFNPQVIWIRLKVRCYPFFEVTVASKPNVIEFTVVDEYSSLFPNFYSSQRMTVYRLHENEA